MSVEIVKRLVNDLGGEIQEINGPLPDGSGFAVASFPLPEDHWLLAEGYNKPPMPFQRGTADPARQEWADKIREAGRYAIRASTMNGKEMDFDPDAMLQNFVVGMLGYWTLDGLSKAGVE